MTIRRGPESRAARVQPVHQQITKNMPKTPQNRSNQDSLPFPLLKGVIVHCLCDVPARDCLVIYAGVQVFGGESRDSLDESVTHVVTLGECGDYEKVSLMRLRYD